MTTGVSFQNASYLGGGVNASVFTSSGSLPVSIFYNTEQTDQKYAWQDNEESHKIQRTARDASVDSKVSKIISHLKQGHEDKALAAYNELLEVMASQDIYSLISQNDTELRAVARETIEKKLDGESLEDLIRNNTRRRSQVISQNIQAYGNCDQTSQEELLKALCDIDEDEGGVNVLEAAWAVISSPFVWLGNTLFGGGQKM